MKPLGKTGRPHHRWRWAASRAPPQYRQALFTWPLSRAERSTFNLSYHFHILFLKSCSLHNCYTCCKSRSPCTALSSRTQRPWSPGVSTRASWLLATWWRRWSSSPSSSSPSSSTSPSLSSPSSLSSTQLGGTGGWGGAGAVQPHLNQGGFQVLLRSSSCNLSISNLTSSHFSTSRWSGVFTCRAENPAGSSVGRYQLTVKGQDLEVKTMNICEHISLHTCMTNFQGGNISKH